MSREKCKKSLALSRSTCYPSVLFHHRWFCSLFDIFTYSRKTTAEYIENRKDLRIVLSLIEKLDPKHDYESISIPRFESSISRSPLKDKRDVKRICVVQIGRSPCRGGNDRFAQCKWKSYAAVGASVKCVHEVHCPGAVAALNVSQRDQRPMKTKRMLVP